MRGDGDGRCRACRRRRLPQSSGALAGRLSAGRFDRYLRAADRTIPVRTSASAIRRREQARCRQQSRHRNRRARAAGRLYRVPRQPRQRHQCQPVQEPAIRFYPRHDACRRLHPRAECHGGQSERAGTHGQRIHRLRQGQSGQGQSRLFGHRHLGAPVRRIVHDDDWRRTCARALSGVGASAHRSPRQSGAGDVRQSAVFARTYPRRAASRAGGSRPQRRQRRCKACRR